MPAHLDDTLPLDNSHYYELRLHSIEQRLKEAPRLVDVILDLEQDLLKLMEAEVMTIYQATPDGEHLDSLYCTGNVVTDIRLPINSHSVAGYVALRRKPVQVNDVRDTAELAAIDPLLSWDSTVDTSSGFNTRNMVVAPIIVDDNILGVVQVVNKLGNRAFSPGNFYAVKRIAEILGESFHYELRAARGPFDLLVEQGHVTGRALAEISIKSPKYGVPVTFVLHERLNVANDIIGDALEQFYHVPYLPYTDSYVVDLEVVSRLGTNFLRQHLWVPLMGRGGETLILAADPSQRDRILDMLQLASDQNFELWVGLPEHILRYLGIEVIMPVELAEAGAALGRLMTRMAEYGGSSTIPEEEEEIPLDNESIIIPVVNCLIADAIEAGASDIHIQPLRGQRGAIVRLRVDGALQPNVEIPASHVRAVISRIKIMAGIDISESRRPQDGKILSHQHGEQRELRVATIPTVNGESVIMRVLQSGGHQDFSRLNFLPHNAEAVERAIEAPHGLILVVGPTGSGKTTTMHGLLNRLNTPDSHIVTIEDPVEITQDGMQQVQVHRRIGLTFAAATRAFLRADPDVILVGETRDAETAQATLEASLTGHLVLSTLHTNSAAETIPRVLLMGLDPLNFADALVLVVAQRLVRSICRSCVENYTASADDVARLQRYYGETYWPELELDGGPITLCRGKGCDACNNSGLKGRAAVHEVLEATHPIKALIANGGTAPAILEIAQQNGMRTLVQDCVLKVLAGQVDLSQVQKLIV